MKTKVAIVGLVVTAIALYFIKRRSRKEEEYVPVKKSHHLTDAFSKAKKIQEKVEG
ncbi:MAG: hypothetical protein ACXWV9_01705 [Flavisolibacter sp.]